MQATQEDSSWVAMSPTPPSTQEDSSWVVMSSAQSQTPILKSPSSTRRHPHRWLGLWDVFYSLTTLCEMIVFDENESPELIKLDELSEEYCIKENRQM